MDDFMFKPPGIYNACPDASPAERAESRLSKKM
jgi:hypothetical protein